MKGKEVLLTICCAFLIADVFSQKMPVKDVIVSDTLAQISDIEFDPYHNRICWQSPDNSLWICHLDTITWALTVPDGKEQLVDTSLTPLGITSNAAEWGFDMHGTYLVYNKVLSKSRYIAIAVETQTPPFWSAFTLTDAPHRINPHATKNPNDSILAFHYISTILDWKTKYKFLDHPDWEYAVWHFTDAHWAQDEQILTGILTWTDQVALFDPPGRKSAVQLTFDEEIKYTKPFMWKAPEQGNTRMFFAVADGTEIRVFKEEIPNSNVFHLYLAFPSPSGNPLYTTFASPEPVVYNNQSYITFMVSTSPYETSCVPAEIWIAKIDSLNPTFQLLSDSVVRVRTDPESFPTDEQLLVYYTEVVDSIAPYPVYRVRKCETGILGPGPATGVDEPVFTAPQKRVAFPNPFHDHIFLQNPEGNESYRLTDPMGRILWEGKNIERKNFGSLKNGIYFLTVRNGTSYRTIRLCRQ